MRHLDVVLSDAPSPSDPALDELNYDTFHQRAWCLQESVYIMWSQQPAQPRIRMSSYAAEGWLMCCRHVSGQHHGTCTHQLDDAFDGRLAHHLGRGAAQPPDRPQQLDAPVQYPRLR